MVRAKRAVGAASREMCQFWAVRRRRSPAWPEPNAVSARARRIQRLTRATRCTESLFHHCSEPQFAPFGASESSNRLRWASDRRPCPPCPSLRSYLDSWAGIGRIAVGMAHQGYDLQLTRYDESAG